MPIYKLLLYTKKISQYLNTSIISQYIIFSFSFCFSTWYQSQSMVLVRFCRRRRLCSHRNIVRYFLFLHFFIFSSSFPSPLVVPVASVLYVVVRLRPITISYLETSYLFGPLLSQHSLLLPHVAYYLSEPLT